MTTRIAPGVGANLLGQHSAERNQDATAYVGNLDPQVSEELLWELFVQAGPVVNVYVPKDRVTNAHQGYGFVEFRSEEDADYAIKVLNMIKLYGKPIRVNKASQDKKSVDVGANLFVGNLDPDVDEKLLYDTFSAFGVIVTNPKIMRDPETGNSRGFGFISYDSFDASDAAIEAMNGQYLCNRQITVSYAYKKDTKGERHGTPAGQSSSLLCLFLLWSVNIIHLDYYNVYSPIKFEVSVEKRILASTNPSAQKNRPHTRFASGPPTLPNVPQANGTIPPPVRPQPFANGGVPPPSLPAVAVRPPPPQVYPPMQMPPPPQTWQGQPQQPGEPHMPLPQMQQQFRNMPPPNPPQMIPPLHRPPPPPTGMGAPPLWRPPPPPQQLSGGPHSMPHMSMPPPPPPSG